MSQLLMNKLRGLAGGFALLVVFLVVGTVDASAQQVQRATTENPYGPLAQKLGIVACQAGTATNVQGGIAALEAQSQTMKSQITGGSSTMLDRVKYEYYQIVVSDVRDYSIAPEFALLNDLSKAAKRAGDQSITNQQLAALYNATKQLFGMCN